MSDMSGTRISVRLDRSLRARIRKQARAAGKKEAEVIREALEKEFQAAAPAKTCYQLGMELGIFGCIDNAPADLSTNRRHIEGFGES
ncbi:MAG TPA: ribbon-helix-helix domain-containing protein [Candidatus Angelobacter sp.]|jgi:hypothetical protein|nr:ribbon-helix-helix domain-containing protein [Candidatus Angelobacter sp.]